MCRLFGIHWDTLNKILEHSETPGYRLGKPRTKRKIGPYLEIIDQILQQDKNVHRKQRHTKRRIFERLRDECGYPGGHTAVKEVVREGERQGREVFMPQIHPPGEAQVDFGFAEIIRDGQTAKVALFVITLLYSDAVFGCVFPRERTEPLWTANAGPSSSSMPCPNVSATTTARSPFPGSSACASGSYRAVWQLVKGAGSAPFCGALR
ncbi:MAG: hypothetical protein IID39_09290 [Planctomycetes bacterium]|nr:hypothetical protein [Planctomycetota bacterium]